MPPRGRPASPDAPPPSRRSRRAAAASAPIAGPERLQRLLADAGVASRRECEAMIEAGRVEVNGRIQSRLPVFADPSKDRITVDGRPVSLRQAREPRVYVMLNKPDKVLSTTRDDDSMEAGGRRTVLDLVRHRTGARLFPVGRLEYHAVGLVLLTNDGDLAQRLTHARFGVPKVYRIVVKGEVSRDHLDALRRMIGKGDAGDPGSDGGVRVLKTPNAESPNTTVEIALREGKNRQLPEILERLGIRVKRLVRVGIGPLRLHSLPLGESRDLTTDEVRALQEATGLKRPRERTDTSPPGGARAGGGRPARLRSAKPGPRARGGKGGGRGGRA